MNKKDLQNILLKYNAESLFASENDLEEFSTFLHKEKRENFLSEAKNQLAGRQALAAKIEEYANQLSKSFTELAQKLSPPSKAKNQLLTECAILTELISSKEKEISTNILVPINKLLLQLQGNNTFLQLQKGLVFWETAERHLGVLSADWEQTKQDLLRCPPAHLISRLSDLLQYYEKAENRLAEQLALAIRSAKAQNTEKYNNILHGMTVYLYDIAKLLKTTETEERYVQIHSCT